MFEWYDQKIKIVSCFWIRANIFGREGRSTEGRGLGKQKAGIGRRGGVEDEDFGFLATRPGLRLIQDDGIRGWLSEFQHFSIGGMRRDVALN